MRAVGQTGLLIIVLIIARDIRRLRGGSPADPDPLVGAEGRHPTG